VFDAGDIDASLDLNRSSYSNQSDCGGDFGIFLVRLIPMSNVLSIEYLLVIGFVFVLAGLVKGVVGFGLPTIGIGIGALITDIPTAMMLILLPTFITNIFQILFNGNFGKVLARTWIFMLGAVVLIPVGLAAVLEYPLFPFERVLGLSILIYGVAGIRGFNPKMAEKWKLFIGLPCGLINSILTGMTGSFSVPGMMYLRALHLGKNDLLCAAGLLFLLSTVGMGLSLWWLDRATEELSLVSLVMCVPVGIGILMGTWIRGYLSDVMFDKIFLNAFVVLGCYLLIFGG